MAYSLLRAGSQARGFLEPGLQVGGEKFLTRNEVMRSLLGHLGTDMLHSFRGSRFP